MGIELNVLHWIFLIFIILIITVMVMKRDTSLVCIVGIFLLGLFATDSLYQSVMGIFNSFIFAIKELIGTILIISIITAMSKVLLETGINEIMVSPFTRLIKTPALAYWVIGILMMVISWFFWPSPAVALLGAVLLPVALNVKLPAMGVAVAMNLFGHGIALSGDFIIQGAPKLTADGAGIPVGDVVAASIPLVIVMGVVTTIAAFFYLGDSAMINVFGEVLPQASHGLVNDLGIALSNLVPLNATVGAITLTSVGAITGLDGSGFSGISLVGPIAKLFAISIGAGVATLTALGQIAAIWVGGGTLIPWAVIPAAAICGVDPFELARRNLKPVLIELLVTTIVAIFLI